MSNMATTTTTIRLYLALIYIFLISMLIQYPYTSTDPLENQKQYISYFLQVDKNWILPPREVEFAISKKGKRCFRKIAKIKLPEYADTDSPQIRLISKKAKRKKGRYLRVRIKANKELPAGHPNAGQKAWLMMDEVLLE